MGEIGENIIEKNINNLSRNTPVALVVGAAGFLGSNLVDELLGKNIQVIGVDDFTTGKRENLAQALRDKKFSLLSLDAQQLSLDIPRLDYLFVVAEGGWKIRGVLEIAKKYSSRIVFVSTVSLYDHKLKSGLSWFKEAEKEIATFAREHNLNARVLRLESVFGARMHFRNDDPSTRLIQEALLGELQKGSEVMEFSSRALYIDDATSLIIKSMLAGATAQKIFDGALPVPIKAAEIKQILLDPLWYETRGFTPTELPPWLTPNLEKTIKELHWSPKTPLVKAFKETLRYFKDNEIKVPQIEIKEEESEKEDKVEELEEVEIKSIKPQKKSPAIAGIAGWLKKFTSPNWGAILVVSLIIYGLIYPLVVLGVGALTFQYQMKQASKYLSKGEFDKSLTSMSVAKQAALQAQDLVGSLTAVKKAGIFPGEIEKMDDLAEVSGVSIDGVEHTILGTKYLYDGLKSVTGEKTDDPMPYFNKASVEINLADQKFSQAFLDLSQDSLQNGLPEFLKSKITGLKDKVSSYAKLTSQIRSVVAILPQIIGENGKKSYLVLLQNNSELRPTGGVISSLAQVDFEGGKLKNINAEDTLNLDNKLDLQVTPPKELAAGLGFGRWLLKDSNWEPDFPTSAHQAEWFYGKEAGVKVDGVVALDLSALENLLEVVGPLQVTDINEKVSADNFLEKTIIQPLESSSGTQVKKSFLTAFSAQLFNNLFFLPNQNWSGILSSLDSSLRKKHFMVYFADTKLLSYAISQNWSAAYSKPDSNTDSLAVVEANLGRNSVNYYLKRSYKLDTIIGKEGDIKQNLVISYTGGPTERYKNKTRIYLPLGTKLNNLIWGEDDLTSRVESFSDYGRSGFAVSLELNPKESKNLSIEYQTPLKLKFDNNQTTYKLDVVKQPGTIADPLEWKIIYPIDYKIISPVQPDIVPQEFKISTDLSTDRRFEVKFNK